MAVIPTNITNTNYINTNYISRVLSPNFNKNSIVIGLIKQSNNNDNKYLFYKNIYGDMVLPWTIYNFIPTHNNMMLNIEQSKIINNYIIENIGIRPLNTSLYMNAISPSWGYTNYLRYYIITNWADNGNSHYTATKFMNLTDVKRGSSIYDDIIINTLIDNSPDID